MSKICTLKSTSKICTHYIIYQIYIEGLDAWGLLPAGMFLMTSHDDVTCVAVRRGRSTWLYSLRLQRRPVPDHTEVGAQLL